MEEETSLPTPTPPYEIREAMSALESTYPLLDSSSTARIDDPDSPSSNSVCRIPVPAQGASLRLSPSPQASTRSTDPLSLPRQFTAKSLQRQSKKATKDEGQEKTKLKKVRSALPSLATRSSAPPGPTSGLTLASLLVFV